MRICLVSGSYPPVRCGVGDQVAQLAARLAAAGEEVHVLTSAGAAVEESGSNPSIHARVSTWRLHGLHALLRHIARINPHIVHVHYPSLGYAKGLAPNALFIWRQAARAPWRSVVTLHEYAMFGRKGRLRLWPMVRFAHRVICTNQRDGGQVIKDHAQAEGRLQIIPLGSNVGSLAEATKSQSPAFTLPRQDLNWLVHFGTIMPNKGWEVMIPALQRLVRGGLPFGLLVVGELQPERYAYHRRVAEMIGRGGLHERIYFTGYLNQEEIAGILLSHRVVVQPYTDGARLNHSSFIAALAYGRAILTTDPLYLLEQVQHGRHFWGIIPHDDRALAEGMKRLAQNDGLVDKLQQGAREAAAYFAWPRIINLYRGAYQQLMKA